MAVPQTAGTLGRGKLRCGPAHMRLRLGTMALSRDVGSVFVLAFVTVPVRICCGQQQQQEARLCRGTATPEAWREPCRM